MISFFYHSSTHSMNTIIELGFELSTINLLGTLFKCRPQRHFASSICTAFELGIKLVLVSFI